MTWNSAECLCHQSLTRGRTAVPYPNPATLFSHAWHKIQAQESRRRTEIDPQIMHSHTLISVHHP